jgi:hypothetical protein
MRAAQVRAIARASTRVLIAHLTAILGSRRAVALAGLASIAVLIGLNALVYSFSEANLGGILHSGTPHSAAVASARLVLAQSPGLVAASVGLVLLMFLPAESNVSLSARIAGASRSSLAVGEFLPMLVAIAVVSSGTAVGSVLFVAQGTSSPVVTFVGLEGMVLVDVLAVLAVNQVLTGLCRVCGFPESVARIAGLLASAALIATVLANLLESVINTRESWMTALNRAMWGTDLPSDLRGDAVTGVIALTLLGVVFVTVSVAPVTQSLISAGRLFSLPLVGHPGRFVNFAVREFVVAVRHPVSQLGIVGAVVLASLLVIGSRAGLVPLALLVPSLAALFSTGVESAFGRSRPWMWVGRLGRMSPSRRALAQILGSAAPGTVLLIIALVIAAPQESLSTLVIPHALVQLGVFSTVAYLSGVVIPYDRSAPLGMLLTSAVALLIDGVLFWVSSTVLPGEGLGSLAFQIALTSVMVAASIAVVGARTREAI